MKLYSVCIGSWRYPEDRSLEIETRGYFYANDKKGAIDQMKVEVKRIIKERCEEFEMKEDDLKEEPSFEPFFNNIKLWTVEEVKLPIIVSVESDY